MPRPPWTIPPTSSATSPTSWPTTAPRSRRASASSPAPSPTPSPSSPVIASRAASARQARARQRARLLALGAVGGRRRQRHLRAAGLLGAEHLVLGLARQQGLELLALDRLALDQDLADLLQRLAVLGQDVLGLLVRGLDDAADLVVDLAGDLVR